MIGRVVSNKLIKTVTVLVEREKTHPLYKKAFLRSKKYLVHDPIGVNMGDMVEIAKIAPISKRKHFVVVKVLGKRMHEITEEKLKKQAKGVIEEIMPEEKVEKTQEKTNKEINKKGGKTKEVVVDNSAASADKKSKTRAELVQKRKTSGTA